MSAQQVVTQTITLTKALIWDDALGHISLERCENALTVALPQAMHVLRWAMVDIQADIVQIDCTFKTQKQSVNHADYQAF
jgi:hypothetical protein